MNFTDILNSKQIEWHPGGKDGEISICCPFCLDQGETEDTKYRLGINILSKKAHCFNCEWSSKENTFNKVLEKLNIEDDDEEIEEVQIKKDKEEIDGKLPETFELLYPKKKDKDFIKAYDYLRQRGISNNQIEQYKIGFCLGGKYSNRIIFPIYLKHKLQCFIGRDFTDKQELRYKNSKGEKTLYGIPKHRLDTALLVEGVIDKLSAEHVLDKIDIIGIPGRTLKDTDIKLLEGYKEIIRVPDDDGPGLRGTLKDAKKLQEAGFDTYISFLSKRYKDINKAYVAGAFKTITNLYKYKSKFTYSLEWKIRTMIATDYRGARDVK